jgi:tetratricopeptide (TPR) repeat protein
MSSRLEEIQKIVALSPNDPFARYGLAMEYRNTGALKEARATFAELLEQHPGYVPQYLMYGNLLRDMKELAEARRIYELGIAAAQKARNQHAAAELSAALDALDEDDADP